MTMYRVWYDNGSGFLELSGTITAETPQEAAEKAAAEAVYGYAVVTAVGDDPERDGQDVILAEALSNLGMSIYLN